MSFGGEPNVPPLPVWHVHAQPPDHGLPYDTDALGVVHARDRYDAGREARRAFPGKQIVVQREGHVMTRSADAKPPKAPPDWRLIARINRARKNQA